jgi:hypothetical protein
VRRVITINKENQATYYCLQEKKKNVMEAKLQSIKVAYFRLKDQMYGLSLKPRSQKKAFNASYNKVIP